MDSEVENYLMDCRDIGSGTALPNLGGSGVDGHSGGGCPADDLYGGTGDHLAVSGKFEGLDDGRGNCSRARGSVGT